MKMTYIFPAMQLQFDIYIFIEFVQFGITFYQNDSKSWCVWTGLHVESPSLNDVESAGSRTKYKKIVDSLMASL